MQPTDEDAPDSERQMKLREELQQIRQKIDMETIALNDEHLPLHSTDPLACLCCCGFKRLGQCYILYRNPAKRVLVIVGPHWIGVLVTLSLILIGTALFLYQQCSFVEWYYILLTLFFSFSTLYFLFQVSCTDPGIVHRPRSKEQEDEEIEEGYNTPLHSNMISSTESDGCYCDICNILQTRKTEHCDECGVCIEEYDHHCPWMGKCIGKNNMYAFKMFNLSWILYVVFVLGISIRNIEWGTVAVEHFHRLSNGEWVQD